MAAAAREGRTRRPPLRHRLVRRIGSRPSRQRRGRRPMYLLAQGTALLGVSLAIVVGSGGSLLGRVLRVALVLFLATYATLADRWAEPWLRVAIALSGGVAGVVLGYGIGVEHAVAAGLTLRVAAGLLALLVGLCMMATGTATALRMLPGRYKVLVLLCVPFSIQFVLAPMVGAVAAANPMPGQLGDITPGDRGLVYDDVELRASGAVVRGWYIPSRNSAAVILVHDSGSTRSSMLSRAVALARHGYGVLLFDTRGNGLSTGEPMELGWSTDLDVRAAVSYVAERYDVSPSKIAVVGVGRGGEAALTAAASDERIAGVVVEGIGRRTPVDTLTLPFTPRGWLQAGVESMTYVSAAVLRQTFPPRSLRSAIKAVNPRPVLLIADEDSVLTSRVYGRASPSNVRVWELPTTPRGEAYTLHSADWEWYVTGFLARSLNPKWVPAQ
ncbi:serine aminopeptidase S33 family [Thermasporomyces composti]|jgi:pimeloyl-ACP methyl ester carboxylesterase|uniref:Serine aminopeptidase S33 family n=2 Tax=Thermasporomyces composti TaxID=696763 RepID=A0A3D9V0J3_THECX|nr:serine aminopeptidase S33 family [Thermasporomyces composti]